MKAFFKRWSKSPAFHAIVCWLIAGYIRLVYVTSRKHFTIADASHPYVQGEKPALFAFWHGRLLMIAPLCPQQRKMHALISTHRDGELIARTMLRFNLGIISGSSTRGGVTAAMNAVKALQAGDNVCITPDGPRGPLMQVQPGLITIAELAGVPIIPITYASTLHTRINSWDRFMVAFPFGSLYYQIGAPLINPSKEVLEAEMVRLTQEVDKA